MITEVLASHWIETRIVDVVDANSIDREIHLSKPDLVVLEAVWVPPAKLAELARLHPKVKWIVRVHSKTPFLAAEGVALEWILEYAKLAKLPNPVSVSIAPNSLELTTELTKALGIPAIYLPNIYSAHPPFIHHKHRDHTLDVGCFGAVRVLKNQLIQATASILYAKTAGKPLAFHINATRQEQGGSEVLKALRALFKYAPNATLVEHPWVVHHDFLRLIASMDIVLQVSFTETFNIVLADAVNMGVPVIGSPEISWLPREYQVGTDSATAIAAHMDAVLKASLIDVQDTNRDALTKHDDAALKEWLAYLKTVSK